MGMSGITLGAVSGPHPPAWPPRFARVHASLSGSIRRRSASSPNDKAHPRCAGTFDNLVQLYLESSDFARLAHSTRRAYKLVIERLVRDEGIGHRLVRQMERKHVSAIVARRKGTPGAANDVLKKLRILLRFSIDNGMRKDDPTLRIKSFAKGTFHTWTDEEISAFEGHWPIGTRERTAFALFLYTASGSAMSAGCHGATSKAQRSR